MFILRYTKLGLVEIIPPYTEHGLGWSFPPYIEHGLDGVHKMFILPYIERGSME